MFFVWCKTGQTLAPLPRSGKCSDQEAYGQTDERTAPEFERFGGIFQFIKSLKNPTSHVCGWIRWINQGLLDRCGHFQQVRLWHLYSPFGPSRPKGFLKKSKQQHGCRHDEAAQGRKLRPLLATRSKQTPVYAAAFFGHASILERLIAAGADATIADKCTFFPGAMARANRATF